MSVQPVENEIIEMRAYLRETLAEIDGMIKRLSENRHDVALRLAAIEAAEDPAVKAAVQDHERRSGEPYEDAQDANQLLGEAHRRLTS
ncbi:MAG: hypothetical protein ACLPQS_13985 [Acidimicrobiales bacterium]